MTRNWTNVSPPQLSASNDGSMNRATCRLGSRGRSGIAANKEREVVRTDTERLIELMRTAGEPLVRVLAVLVGRDQ